MLTRGFKSAQILVDGCLRCVKFERENLLLKPDDFVCTVNTFKPRVFFGVGGGGGGVVGILGNEFP